MKASIQSNVAAAYAGLSERVGLALLAAAVTFETEHQRRVGIANPRPYLQSSKVGEYPKKRTGFGQANTLHQPTSPAEVARLGYVDVGYGENAFYMQLLHDKRGRKGVEDTLQDMRAQLEAVIAKVSQQQPASGGGG